jgi:cell filamentation protein
MLDKYGVTHDKYCYPDSDVLINLLNICDRDVLYEAEAEFTAERYRSYVSSSLSLSDFPFEHLKHLHHHLFQDLYEWAGKSREVDISKGDTRFCTWTRIEPEGVNYSEHYQHYMNTTNMMNQLKRWQTYFVS